MLTQATRHIVCLKSFSLWYRILGKTITGVKLLWNWLGLRVMILETGVNVFSFQLVGRLSANIFYKMI